MKKTLLELTQDVLNDLDMDEVNSIDDTIHAAQVASIVRTTYFEMIGNRNWPHLRKLFQLESVGDLTKPVYLKLPELTKELELIRYTIDNRSVEMKYKTPDEFLAYVSHRDLAADNVIEVSDFSGVKLLIVNDKQPAYWTSFDDRYIVFDSYDVATEDTVQQSKTQCLGYIHPAWSHANDFVPDLPAEAFPALFHEVKSTASVNLKQMVDQKAEQKANRQQRWLSRKAWRAHGGVHYPDYGRKGRR